MLEGNLSQGPDLDGELGVLASGPGGPGADGWSIEYLLTDASLSIRRVRGDVAEAWTVVLEFTSLVGAPGPAPAFAVVDGAIAYRYGTDEDDEPWEPLVLLSDLTPEVPPALVATAVAEYFDEHPLPPAPDVTKQYVDVELAKKSPVGHTHEVASIVGLQASSVGLGNVDNTRDSQKPVSVAQAAALDQKAPTSHQHSAADTTSGVFAPARLGAGTASASTVLYGDGEWKSAPTGGGSGGGFPMPQAPAGHSDVVVPPWSTATARPVGGTIVQPLVMASSRVYDRFAIRAVGAAAGVTVLLQLWRLEGTMWRYMPIGTFDLSSAGLKQITGRWVLPAGQYMYGAYTASNTGNWMAGAPYFGGPQTQGTVWPPSDARQSIWWANASQPVTVDLPGLDQVSLTSVGVFNSPNAWGGGHLPALWARTAV